MFYGYQTQEAPRPAFTITPVKRERTVHKAVRDENGFTVTPVIVEEEGFMVKCYRGHSVYISSATELKRLKLDKMVPMFVEGVDDPVATVEASSAIVTKSEK